MQEFCGEDAASLTLPRVEDAALLRGEGQFIDDLGVRPGTLHASFVRSPIAHGHIKSVRTDRALALPGVQAVIIGPDIAKLTKPFTVGVKAPMRHWALAQDRVRYVGEPVAIVCGRKRWQPAHQHTAHGLEPAPNGAWALSRPR